ncbi:hypothetical protein Tco_0891358 [Tanacetum coccineum]|uniref:Uncharacterized protein n=1 Tax=Tanacetum coccineum TaxID=301880 RepID=A0ABQ5C623_9ASTR
MPQMPMPQMPMPQTQMQMPQTLYWSIDHHHWQKYFETQFHIDRSKRVSRDEPRQPSRNHLMSHWVTAVTIEGDDRAPSTFRTLPSVGKGTRKPIWVGRKRVRLHTPQETRNLGLKVIRDKSGPVPIWFEVNDRETLMPLGDHAAHWANYLGELVRELALSTTLPGAKDLSKFTQFDLRPHMESDRWPQIYAGIQQHLQKIYNGKKAALKERSLIETSATRENPSADHTFSEHTVAGVFLTPRTKPFDEMLRLHGLGSNTPTGVPYTEDEIMAIVRGGKQRGHIPGVGRVLPGQGMVIPPPSQSTHSADIARLKKREKRLTKQMSADVARGHGGDGGGDDRPPPYQVPTGCGGCLGNRGEGQPKALLGGRRAGRLHTRQETRNLRLKAITDKSGPVPIWFDVNDRETSCHRGHAAH